MGFEDIFETDQTAFEIRAELFFVIAALFKGVPGALNFHRPKNQLEVGNNLFGQLRLVRQEKENRFGFCRIDAFGCCHCEERSDEAIQMNSMEIASA